MASGQLPPSKPISNPEHRKLPPKLPPPEVIQLIAAAFTRRRALEASGASREACTRLMFELVSALCSCTPDLAFGAGEVLIRLCDLPAAAKPMTAWMRVRTAPRADSWEYARDHHHCVRVGDWASWAA